MQNANLSLRRGQRRWYDSSSRYLALFVAAVTLSTTAIVFLTAGQELGGVGELVTAAIGLLGLAISLQLETLFRITERARARERYGTLLEMVDDYPDLFKLAADILGASVATLKTSNVAQFKSEVLNVLIHADVRLQELAQGRLRTASSDNTITLDRFATTESLLQATTDDRDTPWWLQDSGTRFFQLNHRLIKDRKVMVERVWILNKVPGGHTRQVIEDHAAIGIKVYLVRADNKELNRDLLINMTMMDGVFLHEDLPNKLGQAMEYLYSENQADLERAKSKFAQLKAHAIEYQDGTSLDKLFGVTRSTLGGVATTAAKPTMPPSKPGCIRRLMLKGRSL